jgi:hypothetical protein
VRLRYVLIIAGIMAMTGTSCKHKGGKNIDEGEIHYSIDYKGETGPVPKEFLPKNLIISFKKDKILFEMLSPVGNSGIINLANPEKNIFDTYLSLLNLYKLYYAAKPGEMFPAFEGMRSITINKTAKTAVICGFKCKNAEVIFPGKEEKKYDIWYTNEINVRNSNASTPFNQIDGVLMSFFFFMGSVEIHFDAETVYQKKLPDGIFERKEDFMRVSREDIRKLINKMVNM